MGETQMRQSTIYYCNHVMIQRGDSKMYISLETPTKMYYRFKDYSFVPLVKRYDAIDEYDNGYWGRIDKSMEIGGCGSLRFRHEVNGHSMLVQVYPIGNDEYRTAWAQDEMTELEANLNARWYPEYIKKINDYLEEKIWSFPHIYVSFTVL